MVAEDDSAAAVAVGTPMAAAFTSVFAAAAAVVTNARMPLRPLWRRMQSAHCHAAWGTPSTVVGRQSDVKGTPMRRGFKLSIDTVDLMAGYATSSSQTLAFLSAPLL